MYVEVKTNQLQGIYKVVEILGGIVAVDNNGATYDCYLKNGEVLRFCTKEGNNLIKNNIQ